MLNWSDLEAALNEGGHMGMFEYRVVELRGKPDEDEIILNEIGKQGWELVSIVSTAVPGILPRVAFLGYLKRPVE